MYELKKEILSAGVQVWQGSKTLETAQGGFILDITGLVNGSTIKAGSPIGYDESVRKARLIKVSVLTLIATSTDTTYQVAKGHLLVVGENIGATKGSKSYAITAIDATNTAYDVITVATTLGANLAVGTVLFQTATTGATAADFIVTPKGLTYETFDVENNVDVAVVIRGTVYGRRVPKTTSDLKAALPNIIYSESF
jgi:hypothetical protein